MSGAEDCGGDGHPKATVVLKDAADTSPAAADSSTSLPIEERVDNQDDNGNHNHNQHEGGDEDEDEDEDSEESDGEPVESLVQGRERRSNQANRYAALLQQEAVEEDGDDELNEIFQEGGDEDIDFEDSDDAAAEASPADEDDDSSSDEDDQGPTAGAGDLEGEKELRKEERAAQRVEKRKAERAFTKIPTVRKRVKIDESATPDSSRGAAAPAERKRKMSERVSWLPAGPPARTSSRTLSVKNKEKTMASMKESEKKRLRQLAIMEAAQKRKQEAKAPPMTQAERMAEAARTEELNSKSLNRWEEMEEEKARKLAARLEAMHNKKIDGPYIRWYSAQAKWINGKLTSYGKSPVTEVVRMNQDDDENAPPKKKPGRKPKSALLIEAGTKSPPPTNEHSSVATPTHENALDDFRKGLLSSNNQTETSTAEPELVGKSTLQEDLTARNQKESSNAAEESMQIDSETQTVPDLTESDPEKQTEPASVDVESKETSLPIDAEPVHLQESTNVEKPSEEDPLEDNTSKEANFKEEPSTEDTSNAPINGEADTEMSAVDTPLDHSSEIATKEVDAQHTTAPAPSIPPSETVEADDENHPVTEADSQKPVETEHTTRNVISFENYDEASMNVPMVRRSVVFNTPLPKNFAPSAHITKRGLLPKKPDQSVCVITKQPAKYRDPVTGLPYATMSAYKAIQRVILGKTVWSDLLGAWVGGDGNAPNGGAATGVPEGFFSGVLPERTENAQSTGDVAVKSENVA